MPSGEKIAAAAEVQTYPGAKQIHCGFDRNEFRVIRIACLCPRSLRFGKGPTVCLYVCLTLSFRHSMFLCVCLTLCLCVSLSLRHPVSICVSVCPTLSVSSSLHVCLRVSLFLFPSPYLIIWPCVFTVFLAVSVYLSVRLSVCLNVRLCRLVFIRKS